MGKHVLLKALQNFMTAEETSELTNLEHQRSFLLLDIYVF